MTSKVCMAFGLLTLVAPWMALADVPTPQPPTTTKPSTVVKEPLPKDWMPIESDSHQFRYFVSKKWEMQGGGGLTTFVVAQPHNKMQSDLSVEEAPCHADTLENVAAAERNQMPGSQPGLKIVTDESTELGGRPAWMFVVDVPYSYMFNISGRPPIKIVGKTRRCEVLTIQGSTRYYVNFSADGSTYASGFALAQPAIGSFEWLNPPPATQP